MTAPPSSFGYHIDRKLGLVTFSGDRTATMPEFQRLLSAVLADPDFRPKLGFLRDRRGLEPLPRGVLRGAVEHLGGFPELAGCRWAVVVSDRAQAGSFHMVGGPGTAPFTLQTFDDIDAAKLWLAAGR